MNMRRFVLAAAQMLLVSPLLAQAPAIEVFFAPEHDCEAEIVHAIRDAKKTIQVQACYFTSMKIAQALVDSTEREPKVRVEVIVDRRSPKERDGVSPFLHDKNIPTFIDATSHKAHSKIILIDGATVITGSFNFTTEARHNAENLLLIRDPKIVEKYAENCNKHWKERKDYPSFNKPESPTPAAIREGILP